MSFARRLQRQQLTLSRGTRAALSRGARAARRGAACGAAMAVAISAMTPAIASVGNDELELDVLGAELLSRAELDQNRGGFSIGAFKLDIGLKITTTINSTLALQSVLTLNAKNQAAQITSNVTKTTQAAMAASQNAGKSAQSVAAGAAASAKASALGFSIPQIQVATKVPQVVVGAVAGTNDNSAKGSQNVPIPVAGEIIQQIQDSVDPTVGNLIPSQTAPTGQSDPAPHDVVTTPQQLAEVILDGVPSAAQANNAGAALAQDVVDALGAANANSTPDVNQIVDNAGTQPMGGQEIAQIVENAGVVEPPASTPEIAQIANPLVVDPATVAALAEIVTGAGPQPDAAQAQAGTQGSQSGIQESQGGTQDLALNDAQVLPEVIMTALAGGTKFDVGDTQVTHQIQNGILASVQNMANGISIDQTVEMSVTISNFNSVIQGALSNMKAAAMGSEIAKFSSTLGN